MAFKYREMVLNELARYGIVPNDETDPDLIREFVNELYLLEIRALRKKMLVGEILKSDYASHVEGLRKRYPILTLPVRHWKESE